MFYCLTFTLRSRVVFTPLVGVCRDEVSGVGIVGMVVMVGSVGIVGSGCVVALGQSLLVLPLFLFGLTTFLLTQPLVSRSRGGRLRGRGCVDRR